MLGQAEYSLHGMLLGSEVLGITDKGVLLGSSDVLLLLYRHPEDP